MYERIIEVLERHKCVYRENADEWRRVPDEYGMNQERANDMEKQIEEFEKAIECLKKEAGRQPVMTDEQKGQKHD